MWNRAVFVVVWSAFFQLADFVGDGLFMANLVEEYHGYPNTTDASGVAANSSYCKNRSFFEDNEAIAAETLTNYSLNLLAFFVVVVFSLLVVPPLFALSIPPVHKVGTSLQDDEEPDGNLDLEVRILESKLRRGIRYVLLLLPTFIHDIPTATLGTSAFAYLVSSQGKRCFTCGNKCVSDSMSVTGWSNQLVFPQNNDYYWLIFIGGKIMGTLGSVSLVLYLEQQYRYQLYMLKIQGREQLLRKHFGPSRSFSRRNYVFIRIASFVSSLIVMLFALLMMLGPALTVVRLNMFDALKMTFLQDPIEFICYTTWSMWGLSLVAVLVSVYYLGFTKGPLKKLMRCNSD